MIYKMIIAGFLLYKDELGKTRFFQKTDLLADIGIKVISEMPFLAFSNANIYFIEKRLI